MGCFVDDRVYGGEGDCTDAGFEPGAAAVAFDRAEVVRPDPVGLGVVAALAGLLRDRTDLRPAGVLGLEVVGLGPQDFAELLAVMVAVGVGENLGVALVHAGLGGAAWPGFAQVRRGDGVVHLG